MAPEPVLKGEENLAYTRIRSPDRIVYTEPKIVKYNVSVLHVMSVPYIMSVIFIMRPLFRNKDSDAV